VATVRRILRRENRRNRRESPTDSLHVRVPSPISIHPPSYSSISPPGSPRSITQTLWGEARTPSTVTLEDGEIFEPLEEGEFVERPQTPGRAPNIDLILSAYSLSLEFREEVHRRFTNNPIPGTEFYAEDIRLLANETTPVLSLPPSPSPSFVTRNISAGSLVPDTASQTAQEREEESLLSPQL
jgi:hypothetical protein